MFKKGDLVRFNRDYSTPLYAKIMDIPQADLDKVYKVVGTTGSWVDQLVLLKYKGTKIGWDQAFKFIKVKP